MKRLIFAILMLLSISAFSQRSTILSGTIVGKWTDRIEVQIEVNQVDFCVYGTCQLKIWQRIRTSRPFDPPQYTWMWVWNSFGFRVEANQPSITIVYYFKPGEDFNYEYQFTNPLYECY